MVRAVPDNVLSAGIEADRKGQQLIFVLSVECRTLEDLGDADRTDKGDRPRREAKEHTALSDGFVAPRQQPGVGTVREERQALVGGT